MLAVCAVVTSVVAVGAKILLAQRAGTTGLVWGTCLAYTVFTLVPVGLYVRRLLRGLNGPDVTRTFADH